jgi:hypothetical protein
MDFEKILKLTINEWKKSNAMEIFEELISISIAVKKIINNCQPATEEDIAIVRNFFLRIAEYIGHPDSGSDIARNNCDHQILSGLICCTQKINPVDELNKLKMVGERTSISVLAFIIPEKYALTNEFIIRTSTVIFTEISEQKGERTNNCQLVNSYLLNNYKKYDFPTAIEMSSYLMFLHGFILKNTSQKGITKGMTRDEQFRHRLNKFLTERS